MIIVFNAAKIMMIAIQTKEIKDFSSTHIIFSVNLKIQHVKKSSKSQYLKHFVYFLFLILYK